MTMTLVVIICHMIAGISDPVCHEEIVAKGDMTLFVCMQSQPMIAEWKATSKFKDEEWLVISYRCISGNYVVRDAI